MRDPFVKEKGPLVPEWAVILIVMLAIWLLHTPHEEVATKELSASPTPIARQCEQLLEMKLIELIEAELEIEAKR